MLVFALVCVALCPFWFFSRLDEEEEAGCFVFVAIWMSCCCKCPEALPHGAVSWSAVCGIS